MSTIDERLERYLHDRSATIDLPHAGVEAISRRARRHRRRRTAAVGGAVAAVLLGGTAIVIGGVPDEDVTKTTDQAASVGASPLEWSIVPVQVGLGWGSTAVSDGSAVYSLSTSPGPESVNAAGEPRHLYRSEDGTDWEDVGLPDGLHASSVAAGDGTVYAVGTAAAGGEAVGVELATSADGGAGWDSASVPVDLAGLADGFPGRITVTDTEVAVGGDTTVVAVTTGSVVDVEALLPDAPPDQWYQGTGGLTRVQESLTCRQVEPAPTTTTPAGSTEPATTAPPTAVTPPVDEPNAAMDPSGSWAGGECEAEGGAEGGALPAPERRTWAELGLTPEQAAIADGQTHLFVRGAEGDLEPVQTIDRTAYADATTSSLLAGDDGWWLLEDRISERDEAGFDISTDIVGWYSADGRTWAAETLATDQATLASGTIDGRPVVVGATQTSERQALEVHRIEGPGAVTSVDLSALLELPDGIGIYAYGVGPAGVAVVVDDGDGEPNGGLEVVHSPDGLAYGRQPLPAAEPGTKDSVNGLTITPDAIKVRLNVRDQDDPGTDPASAQRLFVGTPAG